MRIGIFSESYAPLLNGVAVSIATLIRELRALGHEVFVFAPSYPGYRDEDDRVIRFPSIRTWIDPHYPLSIPYSPQIAQRVRRLDLDIIHTQTPFMLGWLGLKLARRLKIPVVSTNHTQYAEYVHYFPLAPQSTSKSVIIGHMRRYYNQCDGVIVPSNPIAEMLRGYEVRTPIHVIPTGNALDTTRDPEFRARIRGQYGISSDARVLIYVGRLAREKNPELLFESFDRLAGRHDDLRLMIVGGGPYEAECRRMAAELRSSDRIVFTGAIPREKVAKYYSAGDIFAFPSSTDTQGLVLTEAMQAGLPCVAVRAGGSPDVIVDDENGFLVEDTIDDFTAKIDLLLSDDALLKKFSTEAVERSACFTPSQMAVRMLEVYESVRAGQR